MAEYWKSTPKYWCKFCETHVRDTPFAKREHEATGRHQGGIQRSLRKLHKDSEREEREKKRAKDEVARLNGIVSGAPPPSISRPRSQSSQAQPPKQASLEDRKRQMEQLAAMGVVIPEEYRKDLTAAGDWKATGVVREVTQYEPIKGEDDLKPDDRSFGVRKRKMEDEEDEAVQKVIRPGWGSTFKQNRVDDEGPVDMDALMRRNQEKQGTPTKADVKGAPEVKQEDDAEERVALELADGNAIVDKTSNGDIVPKLEDPPAAPTFKKRKARVAKVP
ncbi:MAG: hypothetical protein M1828_002798 [Chrysothrix sp. TS-e1954]|nr:MAG: hypothetical protein M1828_002798 [Chrysothrix sp. TS-e1954]